MGKYKIYHIPGVKIGLSINPKERVRKQKYKEYEILEEHDDLFIASNREIELQSQYGYKVDYNRYHKMNFRKNGIKGSKKWNEMTSNDPNLKKKQIAQMKKINKLAVKANTGRKMSEESIEKTRNTLIQNGTFRGENNPACVLTEDKVKYIRKWCKPNGNGTYTYQRMANAMGISKSQVASVVTRRSWSHI